jgi:hypothetical protein
MTPSPDKLDQLLQQWANERSLSRDDLSALQRAIKQRVADGQQPAAEQLSLASLPKRRSRPFVALTLSVAAVLLIAFGISSYRHHQEELARLANVDGAIDPNGHTNRLPLEVVFQYGDLQRHRRLLAEFQHVFGQRITWISNVNGRVDVGLASDASRKHAASDRYVAIRLTLVSGSAKENRWELVRSFDVLANEQEYVEVPSELSEESPLVLWAYPVDEGVISIDLRCRLLAPNGEPVSTSEIRHAGDRSPIHVFQRDGVEYRLYQTAVLLENDDLS